MAVKIRLTPVLACICPSQSLSDGDGSGSTRSRSRSRSKGGGSSSANGSGKRRSGNKQPPVLPWANLEAFLLEVGLTEMAPVLADAEVDSLETLMYMARGGAQVFLILHDSGSIMVSAVD